MQRLSQVATDIRVLAIAQSGSGKTHLVGTLCKLMPTLVVTGDRDGLDTLRQMQLDPEVLLVEDWQSMPVILEFIKKNIGKYTAIVLDDIGSLQGEARDHIEHQPANFTEINLFNRQRDKYLAEVERGLILGERRFAQQSWGTMWTIMDTFIMAILKLPVPIKLFTTLEAPHDTIRDSTQQLGPKLQGDIREGILATASLVIELTREYDKEGKVIFKASSKPHPKVATKDRYTEAGSEWVNPDMGVILKYIATAKAAMPQKVG